MLDFQWCTSAEQCNKLVEITSRAMFVAQMIHQIFDYRLLYSCNLLFIVQPNLSYVLLSINLFKARVHMENGFLLRCGTYKTSFYTSHKHCCINWCILYTPIKHQYKWVFQHVHDLWSIWYKLSFLPIDIGSNIVTQWWCLIICCVVPLHWLRASYIINIKHLDNNHMKTWML
jgi:hypothetical protein